MVWFTRLTANLMCLDVCRPLQNHCANTLMAISTLSVLDAWPEALATRPDRAFARYICQGIQYGLTDIGFRHESPLKSASSNMESAKQHPDIISEYIRNERALGRFIGPVAEDRALPPLHINRFGVIATKGPQHWQVEINYRSLSPFLAKVSMTG